jgi:hypothetical protein
MILAQIAVGTSHAKKVVAILTTPSKLGFSKSEFQLYCVGI